MPIWSNVRYSNTVDADVGIQAHHGQTYQESNITILSTLFYETRQARQFYEARQAQQFFEARQACHFMKHAKHANFLKHGKHAISWSMPSTEVRKVRQAHEHGKHVSTPNS